MIQVLSWWYGVGVCLLGMIIFLIIIEHVLSLSMGLVLFFIFFDPYYSVRVGVKLEGCYGEVWITEVHQRVVKGRGIYVGSDGCI